MASIKTVLSDWGIYRAYPEFRDTDFIIGKDSFADLIVDNNPNKEGFWFFKNTKKGLVTRFVLRVGEQTEKSCVVTLVKGKNGKFTPRFDFSIWDTTKKAVSVFSKENVYENLIKAKVSLADCHSSFLQLVQFVMECSDVEFEASAYSVIPKEKKDLFENVSKEIAIAGYVEKYGKETSEKDIDLLLNRRSRLEHFRKLLTDVDFFEDERKKRGEQTKPEKVWQTFFEDNPWIFGYGLQLIACEGLDDKKLEQTIVGNDIIDGPGKVIDALLKTKGSISKILFTEIKTHLPNLLVEKYDRPGVFSPAKDLRGAVAQIQKTIHKMTIKISNHYFRPQDKDGSTTGEELLFVKPRGVVVIGRLDDFKTETGINYEQLSSFELYRQQVSGIEIITYDELYARVKFIVEK